MLLLNKNYKNALRNKNDPVKIYTKDIQSAAERLSIKKSAISDAFKTMTKKKLRGFGERRLEHEDMLVVFLDGTPVSGEMMLAVMKAIVLTTTGMSRITWFYWKFLMRIIIRLKMLMETITLIIPSS